MDIGRVLKDSWTIFARDWGALVVAALITFVLSILTLGILSVPLTAGLYLMILRRIREGRPAQVGDVFGCFDRLGAYVVAFLLFLALALAFAAVVLPPFLLLVIGHSGARALGVVLFILAGCAATAVGVYLLTIWIYWTVLMVDRRRSIIEALSESRAIVTKSGFWMTLLVIVVVGVLVNVVINGVSAVTFGIGGILAFVLAPWQFAAYTAMYFQATGETALLPSAFPGPTSAWQGGPTVYYGGPGGPYPPAGYPPTGPYGPYGPPPGYVPPPPGYAPPPPGTAPPGGSPSGYAPPAGPPAGSPTPQAPPWMTAPTAAPPWAQAPAWGQPPAQAAPPSSPPQSGPATPDAALAGQSSSETATSPETARPPETTVPSDSNDPAASDAAPQDTPDTPAPPTPPTPPQPPS